MCKALGRGVDLTQFYYNHLLVLLQARNVYNKIFGGFLMREAFELGWATTCVYAKARPSVVCMDDINFRKPVEVGSLLYLSSQVSPVFCFCLSLLHVALPH